MKLKKIYWSMVDLQCYVNLFYTARWLSRDTYIYTYTYIYICIHTHVCLCVCTQSLSCIWLFASPWTVACQAPLSMEFSRKEYWSGLPFPPPGDLPDLGNEPVSCLAGRFFTTEPPRKPFVNWGDNDSTSGYWEYQCEQVLDGSVVRSCLTLCDPMNGSTPGFPVLHCLPAFLKLMPIESMMPSKHLILFHPLLPGDKRLSQTCLWVGVSSGGVGRQWPAAGSW